MLLGVCLLPSAGGAAPTGGRGRFLALCLLWLWSHSTLPFAAIFSWVTGAHSLASCGLVSP